MIEVCEPERSNVHIIALVAVLPWKNYSQGTLLLQYPFTKFVLLKFQETI